MLFTSDTQFGESISNPTKKTPKTYRVRLDREIGLTESQRLEGGMSLREGTKLLPARIQRCDADKEYLITIVEGKNRQIRRMFQAFDHRVLDLARVSIGPIDLGDLPEGGVRELSKQELESLGWHHSPLRLFSPARTGKNPR